MRSIANDLVAALAAINQVDSELLVNEDNCMERALVVARVLQALGHEVCVVSSEISGVMSNGKKLTRSVWALEFKQPSESLVDPPPDFQNLVQSHRLNTLNILYPDTEFCIGPWEQVEDVEGMILTLNTMNFAQNPHEPTLEALADEVLACVTACALKDQMPDVEPKLRPRF